MQKNETIILREILKKSRWYEKIIIKMFRKAILKVYHYSRVNTINIILR